MRRWTFFFTVLVLTLLVRTAVSQPATCPTLVSEALITVGESCGDIGRNQVCYGNLSLLATPRDPKTELQFAEPGDLIGLTEVDALKLSSISEERLEWGIAIMALQANFPDTLPGQNATMVLFGDVDIEDRSDDVPPLPDVFVTGNDANVRAAPTTTAEVVGRVGRNRPRQVVGKLEDESWLRVVLQNGTVGWVFTSVVDVEGEIATLPVMAVDDPAPSLDGRSYGPMQAFRLRTGIGAPSCSEAPASGIMVQTPDGTSEVVFEANRATIRLIGTVVARTTPETMRMAVVEGRLDYSVDGEVGTVRTGRVVVFDLDANGDVTTVQATETYTDEDVTSLPIALTPRQIVVLTPAEIAVAMAARPVREGIWSITLTRTAQTGCTDPPGVGPRPIELEAPIVYTEDGVLRMGDTEAVVGVNLIPEADGIWHSHSVTTSPGSTTDRVYAIEFEAESGVGTEIITFLDPGSTCVRTYDLDLHYLRELDE